MSGMTTTPTGPDAAETPAKRSIPADTFAARLTLARLHAGQRLSIREAADLCGLNYGTWTGWERGLEPRGLLEVADRISAVLGVDRDWLLFGGPLARSEANRDRWSRAVAGEEVNVYYHPAGRKAPASYPAHRCRPGGRSGPGVLLPVAAA